MFFKVGWSAISEVLSAMKFILMTVGTFLKLLLTIDFMFNLNSTNDHIFSDMSRNNLYSFDSSNICELFAVISVTLNGF